MPLSLSSLYGIMDGDDLCIHIGKAILKRNKDYGDHSMLRTSRRTGPLAFGVPRRTERTRREHSSQSEAQKENLAQMASNALSISYLLRLPVVADDAK